MTSGPKNIPRCTQNAGDGHHCRILRIKTWARISKNDQLSPCKLSLGWSLILYTLHIVSYTPTKKKKSTKKIACKPHATPQSPVFEYAKQLKPNRQTAPGGTTQPTIKTTSRTKKRRSRRGSSTSVHLGFFSRKSQETFIDHRKWRKKNRFMIMYIQTIQMCILYHICIFIDMYMYNYSI